MNQHKTSAIIVAAGRGTRMNLEINKQFVEIGGHPLLSRTLSVFNKSSWVDDICIVVSKEETEYVKTHIIEQYGFEKVRFIAEGGKERQDSVYNGLLEISKGNPDVVLIHDGARPFLSENVIERIVYGILEFGAVTTAVPVKDTIKMVQLDGWIEKTLDRSNLWSIQTPQGFRMELIMKAHEAAKKEGFTGTDDAVLVERCGESMKVVMGDYNNIKITTQEDILLAESLVKKYFTW